MKIDKIAVKIILFYLIIPAIILLVLYPLLPYFLNYPPGSVNSSLQIEIDSITYTKQYILLVIVGLIVSLMVLFLSLFRIIRNIKSLENIDSHDSTSDKIIDKIIKLCINTPIILYCSEIIVPLIVLPLSLIFIGAESVVVMKISLTIILAIMLSSVLCYTFSQKEFRSILSYIHEKYPEKLNHIEDVKVNKVLIKLNSFKFTFLLELVPMFIFSIAFTGLCTYNYSTKLTANAYNDAYSYILQEAFDDKVFYSENELINSLEEVQTLKDNHTKFIIRDFNNYYTNDNSELSAFFQKYALTLSHDYDNRVYDYYCIDNFGSIIQLNIDDTTYLVGIEYPAGSMSLLRLIFSIFIILLIIMCAMISYISTSTSKRLSQISDSFHKMHTSSSYNKHLAVTSIDEIGTFISEFNIIQSINEQQITQIKSNQDMLMEKERLASLGQLIGGISHNLKTPIMSISGAAEGLTDLINEYDASIGDPEVTPEDHHAIANDMREWISKIHSYTAYMSDIITAVKGQAVALSENENDEFTIDELVKRVNILMKHEIRNASLTLETNIKVPSTTTLHGDVNSLVQVVNNLITNAIQAYNGAKDEAIILTVKQDNDNLIISVEDHGCGMPDDVQEKLFKSMITTKGKNGTGLGMFMSYSTIKGHFKGDITFTSEVGKGTTFNVIIPLLNS